MTSLLRADPPKTIVVVRALPGLGDFLVAVPALRALRAAVPGSRIALVLDRRARSVAERFGHLVDELVDFGGFPGIPESPTDDPRAMLDALRALQDRRFDLAVQLHGSGVTSNAYTAMIGARRTAGYHPPELPAPAADTYLPYPATGPELCRNLDLMEWLGAPSQGVHLEFPITDDDRAQLRALRIDVRRPYACIHPGSSLPSRRWPADRFAAVGDHLAGRGLHVVLTGGAAEREITAAVAAAMAAPVSDLAGCTSIGALAALLAGSRVVVTNDTGTSHLADAVRAPSVVVFMVSDPDRWGPLDTTLHRRALHAPPVELVLHEVDALLR